MTQDKARKREVRQLAAATGRSYTAAARALDERAGLPVPPAITPPAGWPAFADNTDRWPAVVVVHRDAGGDRVVVVDVATGCVLAGTTVPHVPADELLAAYTAEGLFPPSQAMPGAPITRAEQIEISLGRPDLTVYRLGYEILGTFHWHQWEDGTWRTPAHPARTQYSVTAAPAPGSEHLLRMVVEQHPGDWARADVTLPAIDVPEHWQTVGSSSELDAALNSAGFTVKSGLWYRLPGRSFYATCRPGQLAERGWWTLARVRIVRETTVDAPDAADRTFRVGEVLTVNQSGYAGREVDRDGWWTSTDIDAAHIFSADCAEVVEVLEDHPPTWAAAALSAAQVTKLLAPHHPGAAEAAAAWAAAGLHVAHEHGGLAIRTPAPQYRRVGLVGRDYWNDNQHTKPYEVVVDEDRIWLNRKLDALPIDPVAAAAGPDAS